MGYMGSGKSTIGKELAAILSYNFIDLDDYIVDREKMSISEIFDKKGEIYFRKNEAAYLEEILEGEDKTVLSLGGGTPCYANNLNLILNSIEVKSFYLKASIPELVKRLKPEKSNRPVINHLKTDEEFFEFFGKHLFERSPFYSKSNVTITTDNKTSNTIVEEIVLNLI